MVRRRQRFEMPSDPTALVRALGVLRNVLICDVNSRVRPFNRVYVLSDAIIKAIDAMADYLTGEAGHFHTKPHGGGIGPAIRTAQEEGEAP